MRPSKLSYPCVKYCIPNNIKADLSKKEAINISIEVWKSGYYVKLYINTEQDLWAFY